MNYLDTKNFFDLRTLLWSRLQETQFELAAEDEALHDYIAHATAQQVDNLDMLIEAADKEAELWKARAERHKRKADSFAALAEHCRNLLKTHMQKTQTTELIGIESRFKLCKAKASVDIQKHELDPAYFKKVVTSTPDTQKIRTDLEMGVKVKGAELKPSFSLRRYENVTNVASSSYESEPVRELN